MPPEELIQLIRTANLGCVAEEIRNIYDSDQIFYEKLVNLFTRAKAKKDKLTKPT